MTTEKTASNDDAKLIERYRPLGLKAVVAAALQQKANAKTPPQKADTSLNHLRAEQSA